MLISVGLVVDDGLGNCIFVAFHIQSCAERLAAMIL